jgi:hypothetical protein
MTTNYSVPEALIILRGALLANDANPNDVKLTLGKKSAEQLYKQLIGFLNPQSETKFHAFGFEIEFEK